MTTEVLHPTITRKQYLNGEFNHRQYYAQFVTEAVKNRVIRRFDIQTLQKDKDNHFNTTPLKIWDSLLSPVPVEIASKMRECGDYPTIAGCVCILKEAALQIVEII